MQDEVNEKTIALYIKTGKPTRLEYGDNWYLVGIRAEDLNGLRVRI